MKYFILLSLLSLCAHAQFMNIKGRVLDPEGNPISGALVRIQQTNDVQTTNIMGNFNFGFKLKEPIAENIVIIIVNSLGFSEKRLSLPFQADEFIDLGLVTLNYVKNDEELLSPTDFEKLTKDELIDYMDNLFTVEVYQKLPSSLRDTDTYEEEVKDLPAFENISKKEWRNIKQNIDRLVNKVLNPNMEDITLSLIIKDQDDRTLYGYEVLLENEEESCYVIYSTRFDVLFQKCEPLEIVKNPDPQLSI